MQRLWLGGCLSQAPNPWPLGAQLGNAARSLPSLDVVCAGSCPCWWDQAELIPKLGPA